MKTLTLATLAACCAAGAAMAGPADDIVGTWECRQPGVKYKNKPPILYVEAATPKSPDKAAFALDVDGFAREVFGNSDVTADADGWWKITPAKGDAFMVRPEGVLPKSKVPQMELKRANATYRCLRLPPAALPAPAAPAAPAGAESTAPMGAPQSAEPAPSAAPETAPPVVPAAPTGIPQEESPKKE